MVFAVNPVQNSTHNFTAFLELAEALNGTNATTAATPSSTLGSSLSSPTTGAASSVSVNFALGLGAVFAIFTTML